MIRIAGRIVPLIVVSVQFAYGQQKEQYTQYIFNSFLINPAIAGIENYVDVKTGHRNQWRGLEGAPITTYVSAHMPLGKSYLASNAISFPQDGENPMSRSYRQTYTAAEPHHGIGVNAVIDRAGPFNRTEANVNYAYHLGLSSRVNIAFGISAGFTQLQLDLSKIILNNNDNIDPAIISGNERNFNPDLGAGIWIYGADFFAGLSTQHLPGGKLNFSDTDNALGELNPHIYVTAGYKLYLEENIAAIPSVLVRGVSSSLLSADLNCKIAYRDRVWFGAGFRKKDTFSAIGGFNINHLLNVSYSYDFTTSRLQSVSSGSHEIVIGLLLNNRYKVICPQRQF